ncbi:MAG: septum formation initiator family protein [Terriglobia bacterium]|jgi:cell division protein FtsB
MKPLLRADPRLHRGAILILALACIALIVHEIFGEHGYLALRREQQELNQLQQQIQQLQQENRELESQIKALKSDPKAIEKLARERMGMARPGEIIVTMPDKHADSQAPPASAKETPPK